MPFYLFPILWFEAAAEQSELSTSRLKELERLTTSLASYNTKGYDDVIKAKDIQLKPAPNVSDDFPNSRVSSISQSAKVRRAKVELGKRQCLERQEIKRQQQALQQRLELIQIENEIEQARLEEQAEDSVKGCGTSKSSTRLGMGLTTTHSCERENLRMPPNISRALDVNVHHIMISYHLNTRRANY